MRILIVAAWAMLSLLAPGGAFAQSSPDYPRASAPMLRYVQERAITREFMVGEWVTRNIEFGRDVEIGWTVRADDTLSYRWTVGGVSSEGSRGTWSIDGEFVIERWFRSDGTTGIGRAKIERIDDNTLRLTIIDNGNASYDGMVRVYRRRPSAQVSMLR